MSHKLKRLTLLIVLASLSSILLAACSQEAKESYNTKPTSAMPEAGKAAAYDKGNGAATNASPVAGDKAKESAGENQVVIQNFAFKPANLTVTAGTKVTWISKDDSPHTVTSTDKRFNSNALDTNNQFSFVFNDKGSYNYFCSLHPQMKGQITVK